MLQSDLINYINSRYDNEKNRVVISKNKSKVDYSKQI